MNISKYLNLELFYYKKFYDINSSKIISNNLQSNIKWTNDKVKMYGKSLILKRRVAWYADIFTKAGGTLFVSGKGDAKAAAKGVIKGLIENGHLKKK